MLQWERSICKSPLRWYPLDVVTIIVVSCVEKTTLELLAQIVMSKLGYECHMSIYSIYPGNLHVLNPSKAVF